MTGRRPYPSDISDARWALIEPTLTAWQQARLDRRPTGEPARTNLREVVNALLYLNRTGISWRYIPHDLPPHGTVTTTTPNGATRASSPSSTSNSPALPEPRKDAHPNRPRRSSTPRA